MKRSMRRLLLLGASLPLLQLAGCTLLDGNLVARTLTGTIFDPLALQLYQVFYNLGVGT